MKSITLALLLLFNSQASVTDDQMEIIDTEEKTAFSLKEYSRDDVDPYYIQADQLVVKGMEVKGFDGESLVKIQKAFDILEIVVNSEEFKNQVINFKNTKGERAFASNNGLSNEEIYAIFMKGKEILQPDTEGEMNFYLKLYNKSWSRVIGYTNGNTNVININWKYFKNYLPHNVAANLAHEWTHKLGFSHSSASEHDSAPYAIGYIVGELASRQMKGMELH